MLHYHNEAYNLDSVMSRNIPLHSFRTFSNEPKLFSVHDSHPSRLPRIHFNEEPCNPNPYAPIRFGREKLSIGINQRDLDYLNECVQEKNLLEAWNKFDEIISTSSICIPLLILLDFISLLCQPDTFSNCLHNSEKQDQMLSRLVNYLHRNNFKDIKVYDDIMFVFSRVPVNEEIFRCLEMLKSRFYQPLRRTLLSILDTYANTEFTAKLLEFFTIILTNELFDPETLNRYFASIRTILVPKRDQVIDMLARLKEKNAFLPHESFILIVQPFISSGDIASALLVIQNASTLVKMEVPQIEMVITKSATNMIGTVLDFVELLDDSQRSMISQPCYSELCEKSIASNCPHGIPFIFSQFLNFNKLIDTSLITKILEFLIENNHSFQIAEIFKTLEDFKNSNEQNSLTNIFLPPTMHKISQILAKHCHFDYLYTFVLAMLNEKIVPLKPVIKCLVHQLSEGKGESKLHKLFECANHNDLVFDPELKESRQPPPKPITHYVIDAKTPTNEKQFSFALQKSNKDDVLTSSIDNMVARGIPPDHVFNHVLVSLGQSNDAYNSFELLLTSFIPGNPDRPFEVKNMIQQILIRTSMRLATNFAFVRNWQECIRFLNLLNKSALFSITLDETYSKELFHFLISAIQASINENDFKEIFLMFEKLAWPAFTLFDQGDLAQYKTELFSLYKHCIEQVDLHSAHRIITYILQDKTDEKAKSGFSQLLSITSNMGETRIALPLFNFMTTNKIDISLDHLIYQKLITFLGQENKLQQAKAVFQHGVDNSCYTAMLSIMANPHQINLYSTLVPLEIKFILDKRLLSLYNMHKDSLTQLVTYYDVKPFEISFHRNTLTTNRTAFQESIRSFIIMLSEEFTPPLIENCSEYLKDINYLKYYKIQISAIRLRQYLLANFVPEKDHPSTENLSNELEFNIQNGKNFTIPNTYKSQFILPAGVKIKREADDSSETSLTSKKLKSIHPDWFSEVKRSINSKLSKFYWTGPITTKEDYNVIAKRIIKMFRDSAKYCQQDMNGVVTTDQNGKIDELIAEEISKLVK